jgi:hypothetical protein
MVKRIVCSPQTMVFITVLLLFAIIVLGGVYLLNSIRETLQTHDSRLVKLLNNLNVSEIEAK